MKVIKVLFITIILWGCNSKPIQVRAGETVWIYQSGKHISDLLQYNPLYFTINEDGKIYKKGKYFGKIIKVNSSELIIMSDQGDLTYYAYFKEYKNKE